MTRGPLVAMLLIAALLASCSRDAVPATGSAADSYLPLIEGARWRYELRASLGTVDVEMVARGPRELPQSRGTVFVVDERTGDTGLPFVGVAPVGYRRVDEGYWARITAIDWDESGSLRFLGQEDATWILPVDPRPGQVWGQENAVFATPEHGGGLLGWSGEVRERLSVTVPAGTFDDVLWIEIHFNDPREGVDTKIVYYDYYARGVGLVKSVTLDPSGERANTIEQVLVEYRFPE